MENKEETGIAIFNQICEVNTLDPDTIREEATANGSQASDAEALIREAFRYRANELVAELNLSSNSSMTNGKEYQADGDPTAPSFTVNDAYIRQMYDADEADQIISALGQVQLPIRA